MKGKEPGLDDSTLQGETVLDDSTLQGEAVLDDSTLQGEAVLARAAGTPQESFARDAAHA
jgi:hypothetical protein